MGPLFVLFAYLVVVGSSNAVNLTDGLDGLAILPTVLVGTALGIIAYLSGRVDFAEYLHIPYIPGSGEMAVFCGSIAGAGLGFHNDLVTVLHQLAHTRRHHADAVFQHLNFLGNPNNNTKHKPKSSNTTYQNQTNQNKKKPKYKSKPTNQKNQS